MELVFFGSEENFSENSALIIMKRVDCGNDSVTKKNDPEDIELIRNFVSGDERSFEVLYHRYRRQLYGFLNNLIQDGHEADEVFEETWLRVVAKLPGYRDQGRFSAWLFRLARNIFIDRLRRNRSEKLFMELDAENPPQIPAPERMGAIHPLDSREMQEVVAEAVARLPEEQREVFLLRQQELAFKEIAAIQECSLNTVLSRMHYAMRNLRRFILERLPDGPE